MNLPLASGQKSYWRAMSGISLQLVYHLTVAKVILSNTDHIPVPAGWTINVKGSNYHNAVIGKICHNPSYQRTDLTRKK